MGEPVNINFNGPEAVALELLKLVMQRTKIETINHKWLLDTYDECRVAVAGRRNMRPLTDEERKAMVGRIP